MNIFSVRPMNTLPAAFQTFGNTTLVQQSRFGNKDTFVKSGACGSCGVAPEDCDHDALMRTFKSALNDQGLTHVNQLAGNQPAAQKARQAFVQIATEDNLTPAKGRLTAEQRAGAVFDLFATSVQQ